MALGIARHVGIGPVFVDPELVVHELAHLLEPTHNARFVAPMDRSLSGWQSVRLTLNSRGRGRAQRTGFST